MSKEIGEIGCFLETAIVANTNYGGSELEASTRLDEILETAVIQGITKRVQCNRCQTTFKVYHDGVVITDGPNACDRPLDIPKAADSSPLRIDVDNLAQPIIWPNSAVEAPES